MLLPVVLILFAGYWAFALSYVRRARTKGKKYPLLRAWVVCFLLFFGDHAAGYLWFKLYTSTISVPGPVTLITDSLAIEDDRQDIEQYEQDERNKWRCCGIPPVVLAVQAVFDAWKPFKYGAVEQDGKYFGDISEGLSHIEIVDLSAHQNFPSIPPKVLSISLLKRPDSRCAVFESWSKKDQAVQYQRMAVHGLIGVERYCIGSEFTSGVTARYTMRRQGPGRWVKAVAGLLGLRHGSAIYLDTRTGETVAEFKAANFYGGWVWQFARFLPDMDYTVAEAQIATRLNPDDCCKVQWRIGINLLPYTFSSSLN